MSNKLIKECKLAIVFGTVVGMLIWLLSHVTVIVNINASKQSPTPQALVKQASVRLGLSTRNNNINKPSAEVLAQIDAIDKRNKRALENLIKLNSK